MNPKHTADVMDIRHFDIRHLFVITHSSFVISTKPLLPFLCLLLAPLIARADPLSELAAALPSSAADCTAQRTARVAVACGDIENWTSTLVWESEDRSFGQVLRTVHRLVLAKGRVDDSLDRLLAIRTQPIELPPGEGRRAVVRQYLQLTSQLIDLSGRMRYLLRDAIDGAAYWAAPHTKRRHQLLDMLIDERVSIGASVMAVLLTDPPPESGAKPARAATQDKVLTLIAACREVDLLPDVVELIQGKNTPAWLTIRAAEVIGQLGLPQDPHPDQDPDLPKPPITARQLHQIISRIDTADLSEELARRRTKLLRWLDVRIRQGVVGDSYRIGGYEIRAGDWLLMRNPSPYNLFTDLSPGLFTHVGVVSVQEDQQGIRRFVVVDLPERGDRIPVTNAETYVQRTLHYFFVRHQDPQVGRKMGQVAGQLIGNPTQFDLTFRTDRVLALKGKPLRGQRINTYCAGFLLLCAQETSVPRRQFFPLTEYPAGGHTQENLQKLGLSIGKDFVSPTGALFSPQIQIVGRREPMYDPGREIKESIYDHFAHLMRDQRLTPSPDGYQALREKLAKLAKDNPWLQKALAKASGVSQHMDLVSAAKAAAVVETLDEIAELGTDDFFDARYALRAGPIESLSNEGWEQKQLDEIKKMRVLHAHLHKQWTNRAISPRDLRLHLVRYYVNRGEKRLEERFFSREK